MTRNEAARKRAEADPTGIVHAVLHTLAERMATLIHEAAERTDEQGGIARSAQSMIVLYMRDCLDADGEVNPFGKTNTYLARAICEVLADLSGPAEDDYAPSLLALVVEAMPEAATRRHVTVPSFAGDRPMVRAPAVLDLASFGSLNEIEAIEVDAEPVVSRTATIDGLKHRRPRKRAYPREPVQGELVPGPRTLAGEHVGDVVLRALSLYELAGDERNPIRGDIYRLALATFAISGAMTIQPAAGAKFIGGRDTPANRVRWWAASESLHGLTIRVNERTGEWRNLAVVDVEKSGTVHVAPPAWWRGNDRWRLAGGLFRPVLIGE